MTCQREVWYSDLLMPRSKTAFDNMAIRILRAGVFKDVPPIVINDDVENTRVIIPCLGPTCRIDGRH